MADRRVWLAQQRRRRGLSQEQLAQLVGVDVSTVQRWEAGSSAPQLWSRAPLAEALDLTPRQLERQLRDVASSPRLTGASASDSAAETGVSEHLIAWTTEPVAAEDLIDGVGEVLDNASGFTTLTQLLASQRQRVAPDVLLSLVEAHGRTLSGLFQKASSDPLRRDIGLLLGEITITASRLWSAIGNRRLAITCCVNARRLGWELDDSALRATAMIFESNLRSDAATMLSSGGDVVHGLRLLSDATSVGGDLQPAAQARTAAERAQCYAALGSKQECESALGEARRASALIPNGAPAGLFSDWRPARVDVYEGTCRLLLGDAARAVTLLTRALAADRSNTRDMNVDLAASVDLAAAHALAGNVDHACSLFKRSYVQLVQAGNHRGISRAHSALRWFVPWKDERPTIELREFVRDHGTVAARLN